MVCTRASQSARRGREQKPSLTRQKGGSRATVVFVESRVRAELPGMVAANVGIDKSRDRDPMKRFRMAAALFISGT